MVIWAVAVALGIVASGDIEAEVGDEDVGVSVVGAAYAAAVAAAGCAAVVAAADVKPVGGPVAASWREHSLASFF